MPGIAEQLKDLRRYYDSGATKSYEFRKEQLKKLKAAVLQYENEIYEALYSDLKKCKEETYAAEIGLLLAEINVALKNLRRWMAPQRAATDLVNLPSQSKIYKDPLGVVLIISPWNYPLQLALIPLVGAIAGGNCAVVKPSELSSATSAVIEKIISQTFSPGYIKVILGDGAEKIPEMMNVFRFDHIFYTGSIPVGRSIYQAAAKDLIPVTLELGGKTPAIVEADADIALASKRIVFGKFLNTGQTCIAPDYLLVHESIKEKLVIRMKSDIEKFYTKDPAQSYEYGKIINERRFDKLLTYLSQGKIIAGGKHNRSKLY
ncbi:MAG: aldehyde dehydrogenase family protein, partial [Chitinophagaceae bacterium]|nr:aldehyde dehydrogenase family protein [Chitinophagaceae bacterium]